MQKTIYIILPAFFLCSCGRSDTSKDKNAYIVPVETTITGKNTGIQVVRQPRYFSYGFWKYLAKEYPAAFSGIFQSGMASRQFNFPQKDTSYLQVELDSSTLGKLHNDLPVRAIITSLYIARDYKRFIELINDSINRPVFIFSKNFVHELKNY